MIFNPTAGTSGGRKFPIKNGPNFGFPSEAIPGEYLVSGPQSLSKTIKNITIDGGVIPFKEDASPMVKLFSFVMANKPVTINPG